MHLHPLPLHELQRVQPASSSNPLPFRAVLIAPCIAPSAHPHINASPSSLCINYYVSSLPALRNSLPFCAAFKAPFTTSSAHAGIHASPSTAFKKTTTCPTCLRSNLFPRLRCLRGSLRASSAQSTIKRSLAAGSGPPSWTCVWVQGTAIKLEG